VSRTDAPWRRDPEQLGRRLAAWLRAVPAINSDVIDVTAPQGSGMSSETILFSIRGSTAERYVARLAPDPSVVPVFPVYDFALQQRCMDIVRAHTDVPTPRAPWLELDPAWLGAPFLVMERIDGQAPADVPPYTFTGWVCELTPDERAAMQTNAVSVLARLHELNPRDHDLSFLDRPEHGMSPLDQHVGYQRWYYDWAREGQVVPIVERLFDWLRTHRPPEADTVLNWGDARIGNILWQRAEPVAVLDWEMAALGPREIDVAWIIWLHQFFVDLAGRFGELRVRGMLTRRQVVADYERMTGRPLEHLEWYEVFAALRHAIITIRTSGRTVAFGGGPKPADPDELILFRDRLEQMLDGSYWSHIDERQQ
jgi:aminoglycoside phosphotransferase (APT) family kinase protein